MGDFVMPKHTGLLREFIAPLKVCYEKRKQYRNRILRNGAR